MQITDSHTSTVTPADGKAVAKPRLRDQWAKCARKAVALIGAGATVMAPMAAQAQGSITADAFVPPAAADTDINNSIRVILGQSSRSAPATAAPPVINIPSITNIVNGIFGLGDTAHIFNPPASQGPVYAAFQLNIDAPAWQNNGRFAELILDANTGEIVYERNGLELRHFASMNKVMTAYLVFEALENGTLTPDTMLTVSAHGAGQGGMSMNLRRGQQVSVRDALNALLRVSANDAAVTLAEGVAGSEPAFAARMNETAQRLGARNSSFESASGRFGDQGTAYDMTQIFMRVRQDYPQYYSEYFTSNCTLCQRDADMHATGSKTGTRSVAGYNVVVRVEHEGRDYILVTMGAPNNPGRFGRASELADAVWSASPPASIFGSDIMTAAATPANPPTPAITVSLNGLRPIS